MKRENEKNNAWGRFTPSKHVSKKLKPEILTGWKKRIPPDNIFSFNQCSFGGESQKIDWTNERSRSAD